MRHEFAKWFDVNKGKYTEKGNLKNPKQLDICKWVLNSKNQFKNEIIVNSFVCANITDNLDSFKTDSFINKEKIKFSPSYHFSSAGKKHNIFCTCLFFVLKERLNRIYMAIQKDPFLKQYKQQQSSQ